MRSFRELWSLSLLVFIFLLSCGPRVDTEKRTARDMSSFTSYSFLPNQDTIRTSSYDNTRVNEVVIDQINLDLQDKGLRLDRNQPDLLVYYHLMLEEEVGGEADPVYNNYQYYRPGYYIGPYYRNYLYHNYYTVPRIFGNVDQIPYKEGTIVIDLIDRRTNQIVWRGRADDVVEPRAIEQELRTYVTAILEEYPR